MLTYSTSSAAHKAHPTEKPWVLILLAFFWLWPGVLGHDPWRPDEPYVLAVVTDMLATGHWIIPTIQGEPYLAHPPLYYWVAALCVSWFSWALPLHDAARMATPIFMVLALLCAGGAGRELMGRWHGRSVVLILIGCLGLIDIGHRMSTEVAGFTGYAVALYALTLSLRLAALAGALLGLASALLFLSVHLLDLILLWFVVLMLPAFSAWRQPRYLITLAMALLVGVPLIAIWPLTLYKVTPQVFIAWWQYSAFGELQGIGPLSSLNNLAYYFKTALWYLWPAWPLALWALYRHRQYDQPVLQLPLMFFGVILLLLSFSGVQTNKYALPLLLPITMIAALGLDSLKRGGAAFLNWFGMMTFGLFGLLIWLGWLAMNFAWPEQLSGRARYFSPYYQPHISFMNAFFALLATLVWIWALTRRNVGGRQAVTNWAAGMTLFWSLAGSLWLPWLDAMKSYRPVVDSMMAHLPHPFNCVAIDRGQMIARISWDYFAQLRFNVNPENDCALRVVVRPKGSLADDDWQVLWQGSRPREDKEIYVLQQRPS